MIKEGLFYHDIRNLLKNNNKLHIIVNNSRSPISDVEENKKQYASFDVNRYGHTIQFYHITFEPVK